MKRSTVNHIESLTLGNHKAGFSISRSVGLKGSFSASKRVHEVEMCFTSRVSILSANCPRIFHGIPGRLVCEMSLRRHRSTKAYFFPSY